MKVRFGEFFEGFTHCEAMDKHNRGAWELRVKNYLDCPEHFEQFWEDHENDIVEVSIEPCVIITPADTTHIYHILSWEIEDKWFEYQVPMNAEEIIGALDSMSVE